jgi:hypothetical protein
MAVELETSGFVTPPSGRWFFFDIIKTNIPPRGQCYNYRPESGVTISPFSPLVVSYGK